MIAVKGGRQLAICEYAEKLSDNSCIHPRIRFILLAKWWSPL